MSKTDAEPDWSASMGNVRLGRVNPKTVLV